MRAPFAFALLALAAGLTACGRAAAGPVTPDAPAYVEVENQSFYDMTVYASRSGARIRLGMVSGNSTQVMQIPRSLVNPGVPIRFMADPVGGQRSPYTEEIIINPGETIVLRIPPG